ncbi:hypothetical protein WA026_022827 [Henosepilachna vigintioctopunctata]|uniref:Uncharacterized protein n=1 Tax=Henosepilachna vigintioctopunctata TaxID=420089 RepID=A0AAW1UWI8_9CUCU
MEQLRFEFALLPTSDGKSSIYCVTSITTREHKMFAIPEEIQSVGLHKELIKTSAYNKVKNRLKKRYQTRKVWIKMSDELSKIYVDEDGGKHLKILPVENREEFESIKLLDKTLRGGPNDQNKLKEVKN